MIRPILVLLLIVAIFAPISVQAQAEPLHVVATTTIIADVARNVGGDLVNVAALVPFGSDVHAFQSTPNDAALVADADVLLVNGAGLESFLGGLIENAGGVEPVVVSNGIEMLPFAEQEHDESEAAAEAHAAEEHIGILGVDAACASDVHEEAEHQEGEVHQHGGCDPHVWTNPNNVKIWANNIAAAFAAADPDNADVYTTNAAAYIEQLTALDTDVRKILGSIPEDRRILVTNHEFLGYFAQAYDFEVVGVVLPGGSTLTEPDPQALAALIDVIRAENVPAIFTEASASSQLAAIVAEETGIQVVTTLYSDSLSDENGSAPTYLDFVRFNAQTIADALV